MTRKMVAIALGMGLIAMFVIGCADITGTGGKFVTQLTTEERIEIEGTTPHEVYELEVELIKIKAEEAVSKANTKNLKAIRKGVEEELKTTKALVVIKQQEAEEIRAEGDAVRAKIENNALKAEELQVKIDVVSTHSRFYDNCLGSVNTVMSNHPSSNNEQIWGFIEGSCRDEFSPLVELLKLDDAGRLTSKSPQTAAIGSGTGEK